MAKPKRGSAEAKSQFRKTLELLKPNPAVTDQSVLRTMDEIRNGRP